MDNELASAYRLLKKDPENKLIAKKIKILKDRNCLEEAYFILGKGEYYYPHFFKGPKIDNWLEYIKDLTNSLARKMIKEKKHLSINFLLCNILESFRKKYYREYRSVNFLDSNFQVVKAQFHQELEDSLDFKKMVKNLDKNRIYLGPYYKEKCNVISVSSPMKRQDAEKDFKISSRPIYPFSLNSEPNLHMTTFRQDNHWYVTMPIQQITFDTGYDYLVSIEEKFRYLTEDLGLSEEIAKAFCDR